MDLDIARRTSRQSSPGYVVARNRASPSTPKVHPIGALRILLVDDHVAFAASARALLASEGADIVGVAHSGEEALAQFAVLLPDLVLLDICLPGMSGIDVAHRVSHGIHRADVILISSDADAATDPDVQNAPVLGFLHKRDLTWCSIDALLH